MPVRLDAQRRPYLRAPSSTAAGRAHAHDRGLETCMNLAANPDSLPFGPRQLSRSELIRLDVYQYDSPKLDRRVTVVRPTALALAIEYELDPDKRAYVERPRVLAFEGGKVELSFWTATRKGLEQFVLLTSAPPLTSGPARAFERRTESIQAAARNAQIALVLVPESQLLRRSVENANRLRLLPWIQTARELPKAAQIEGRLMELFQFQPRQAFSQVERALESFGAREVRAMACAMVHAGRLKLDLSAPLHAHSMLEAGVLS